MQAENTLARRRTSRTRRSNIIPFPGRTANTPTAPSPPADYPDSDDDLKRLDLNGLLVKNSETTYFLRARGDSLSGLCVQDGDLLVADRSEPCGAGDVVAAYVRDWLLIGRLARRRGKLVLTRDSATSSHPATLSTDFKVWAKITHAIHSFGEGGAADE